MRLIDADTLKDTLLKHRYTTEHNQIFRYIDEQPTAYDIGKVVEKLEEASNDIAIQYENNYEQGVSNGIEKAIEIVKQGGVADDVCEWKTDNVGASIGCRSDLHHTGYVNRAYCPYCGKRIKVVE